jgi:hypothetical protein
MKEKELAFAQEERWRKIPIALIDPAGRGTWDTEL